MKNLGVMVRECGSPRPILQALAARGFGMVAEAGLKYALTLMSKPVPEAVNEDIDFKCELQMACLHGVNPELTDVDAASSLHKGYLLENPTYGTDIEIPVEEINEVITGTERKELQQFVDAVQAGKAKKKLMQATRSLRASTYFKQSAAPKFRRDLKSKPRWTASASMTVRQTVAWIMRHLPDKIQCYPDEVAGRFRVIGPELVNKSVAWTKRGMCAAAMECVYHGWSFYTDHTGHSCPYDVDELQSEFADVAQA